MRYQVELETDDSLGRTVTIRTAESATGAANQALAGWRSDAWLDDYNLPGRDTYGEYIRFHAKAPKCRSATLKVRDL